MTGKVLKCHMLSPFLWALFPMGSTEAGLGRLREGDFGKRGDDAQGIELELPHCGSAAFLTRLGELGRKYAGCGCFFWTEI